MDGSRLSEKFQKDLSLLVGVTHEDTEEDAAYLAEKIANLRVFLKMKMER